MIQWPLQPLLPGHPQVRLSLIGSEGMLFAAALMEGAAAHVKSFHTVFTPSTDASILANMFATTKPVLRKSVKTSQAL